MLAIAPINVDKATPRIMRAVRVDAFHNNPRAVRLTLECRTQSIVSVRCVLRAYNAHGHRVALERIAATLVRARKPIAFEDYSGYATYSRTRSLYYYPTTH